MNLKNYNLKYIADRGMSTAHPEEGPVRDSWHWHSTLYRQRTAPPTQLWLTQRAQEGPRHTLMIHKGP